LDESAIRRVLAPQIEPGDAILGAIKDTGNIVCGVRMFMPWRNSYTNSRHPDSARHGILEG
jgi:hypothetical protein